VKDAHIILLVLLVLAFCACMPAPPELINDTAIPDSAFAQLHRQVEVLAQADIPLWDFTIHIYEDAGRYLDESKYPEPLPGGAFLLSWTNATSKIHVLASEEYPLVEVTGAVAHALGHVHFEQGAHDPDWDHERLEWFGPGGVVEQIVGLILEEASHGEN
jgi:hypothetical protein